MSGSRVTTDESRFVLVGVPCSRGPRTTSLILPTDMSVLGIIYAVALTWRRTTRKEGQVAGRRRRGRGAQDLLSRQESVSQDSGRSFDMASQVRLFGIIFLAASPRAIIVFISMEELPRITLILTICSSRRCSAQGVASFLVGSHLLIGVLEVSVSRWPKR